MGSPGGSASDSSHTGYEKAQQAGLLAANCTKITKTNSKVEP